jgi:hypothetical protein
MDGGFPKDHAPLKCYSVNRFDLTRIYAVGRGLINTKP